VRPRNSAASRASAIRRRSRRGWRRLLALCGVRTPGMRRADAVAARWEHGAVGEAATVRLLAPLVRAGWHVRHDLRLAGRRFNVDHVLVSPCGTAVVVADTKTWHRGRETQLVGGRVHCGDPRLGPADDRHDQVEAVARPVRAARRSGPRPARGDGAAPRHRPRFPCGPWWARGPGVGRHGVGAGRRRGGGTVTAGGADPPGSGSGSGPGHQGESSTFAVQVTVWVCIVVFQYA
jgi:hypothetical protein